MKLKKLFFLFAASALLFISCDYIKEKAGGIIDGVKGLATDDENVEPAELQFWESYSGEEIAVTIIPALENYSLESGRTDLSLMLTLDYNAWGAVVGYAQAADTAAVSRILEGAFEAGVFNRNEMRFAWGYYSVDGSMHELYALVPDFDGTAAMDGNIIKEAKADFTQFSSAPCISIELNDDAARQFADLTGRNVGKPLPIVINGFVYSAPCVQSRIDGGKVEITGNFSQEDTERLAKMLNACKK